VALRINNAAISPDGSMVFAHYGTSSVVVWLTRDGRVLWDGTDAVGSVAFSWDGKRVAAQTAHGIKIWESRTGRVTNTDSAGRLISPIKDVFSTSTELTFDENGDLLAAGEGLETSSIWRSPAAGGEPKLLVSGDVSLPASGTGFVALRGDKILTRNLTHVLVGPPDALALTEFPMGTLARSNSGFFGLAVKPFLERTKGRTFQRELERGCSRRQARSHAFTQARGTVLRRLESQSADRFVVWAEPDEASAILRVWARENGYPRLPFDDGCQADFKMVSGSAEIAVTLCSMTSWTPCIGMGGDSPGAISSPKFGPARLALCSRVGTHS
jgi:hypothetical protein